MRRAPTLWEEGRERGGKVVALGIALALTLVLLDRLLGGGLDTLFDVGFVLLCVAMALLVRPQDFFTIGVLPPLLMLGVCLFLALVSPGMIAAAGDGAIQALVTGLAAHSVALGVGYVLCLGVLAMRQHVIRTRSARRRRLRDAAPLEPRPTSR